MNVDIILENVYHSFRSVVNVQYAEDELPSIDELIGRLLAKPAGELDLLMDFTEQLDAKQHARSIDFYLAINTIVTVCDIEGWTFAAKRFDKAFSKCQTRLEEAGLGTGQGLSTKHGESVHRFLKAVMQRLKCDKQNKRVWRWLDAVDDDTRYQDEADW